MRRPSKGIKRITIATAMVILTLVGCVTGTYAWFMSCNNYSTEVGQFSIMNRNARIKNVKLLKFCYAGDSLGGYDYTDPGSGHASGFEWNEAQGSFGSYQMIDAVRTWVPVDIMNLYDPLETEITGTPLIDLNCNAVFEITFESNEFLGGATVVSSAMKRSLAEVVDYDPEDENNILLSTCVDFDVFTPDDLVEEDDESNPFYNTETEECDLHKPSYLKRAFRDDDEENYFKISYLSSLKASHADFYSEAVDEVTISNDATIGFDYPGGNNEETPVGVLYVNVNYSPTQLAAYRDAVSTDNKITAVYDYYLSFLLV